MPISHKTVPSRIVIYAQDIKNITVCSERSARSLMQKIRRATGKKAGQFVTISDFSQFTGIQEEEIKVFLAH